MFFTLQFFKIPCFSLITVYNWMGQRPPNNWTEIWFDINQNLGSSYGDEVYFEDIEHSYEIHPINKWVTTHSRMHGCELAHRQSKGVVHFYRGIPMQFNTHITVHVHRYLWHHRQFYTGHPRTLKRRTSFLWLQLGHFLVATETCSLYSLCQVKALYHSLL